MSSAFARLGRRAATAADAASPAPGSTTAGPAARRLRIAVPILLAGAVGIASSAPAEAQTRLPDLGDAAGEALSRAEEDRLGDAFLRQIRGQLRLVDDPEVVDYVNALGRRISRADPKRRYRFLVVDTPAANAFAGPGGIIAVNAGLIVITETESELASVLAHEVAHVAQRHIAQMIERSQASSLTTLATIFGAIVLATQNAEVGQAALAASVAGAQHAALQYSRENEKEADRVGMVLLDQAGFDPRAMPAFFERFQEWQRFTSKPPEYLSTHPATLSRIADLRGRAEQLTPRTYREGSGFPLIRAKLQVRTAASPADALAHFESRAGADPTEADRYGLALALMATDRWAQASDVLDGLRRDFPARAAHRVAAAQVYTALGEQARSFELLAESAELLPEHRAVVYGYGRALIEAGQADDAATLLRTYQRKHDSDAALYRLLGLAHQRAGRAAASHLALAEFHFRNGNLEPAIRQLDIALADPGIDEYQGARALARREEWMRERKRLRSRR